MNSDSIHSRLDHRAARRDINALRELGVTWGGAPVETIEDPVLLHRAARAIGGGPKPWGYIFSELLGGNIAYSISQDASARISIPGCDAIGLRSLELTDAGSSLEARISQRDAVEILNLPPSTRTFSSPTTPSVGNSGFAPTEFSSWPEPGSRSRR